MSSGSDPTSRQIDLVLKKERETFQSTIKLLLLGAGECGKSTILKQMKILHSGGFTKEEVHFYKDLVYKNLLDSIQTLIFAAEQLEMKLEPIAQEYATVITSIQSLFPGSMDQIEAIEYLWNKCETVHKLMRRTNEFTLLDSAPYFLANAGRILAVDYTPTEQDILRTRFATIGVIEYDFIIDGINFKFVDVGGQRGERKKWIHSFENVSAILFVASLNEYDQFLMEDRTKNRLIESLNLFEGIIHLPWFTQTSIILFLNKHDLFKEKITRVDPGIYFSDYSYGCDYGEALFFIKEMFFSRNRIRAKTIYAHVTDATDTHGMKFVWKATKDIIIHKNLRTAGLEMV